MHPYIQQHHINSDYYPSAPYKYKASPMYVQAGLSQGVLASHPIDEYLSQSQASAQASLSQGVLARKLMKTYPTREIAEKIVFLHFLRFYGDLLEFIDYLCYVWIRILPS